MESLRPRRWGSAGRRPGLPVACGRRSGLRFGIRFHSDSGTIPRVAELARLAEAAGFDDVWVCHDLLKRDAWITLTAIAAATRRIRLGTAIANPFPTDPSEIARSFPTCVRGRRGPEMHP
ncbi:MAG: LLM class flavin-dependent oxidoreductase [Armatimonadetes bacterium]|nr:LLM class flavin-dependent oxidoreductase [Armatimonadota bacterium]